MLLSFYLRKDAWFDIFGKLEKNEDLCKLLRRFLPQFRNSGFSFILSDARSTNKKQHFLNATTKLSIN